MAQGGSVGRPPTGLLSEVLRACLGAKNEPNMRRAQPRCETQGRTEIRENSCQFERDRGIPG
jgi:hypothetical protein